MTDKLKELVAQWPHEYYDRKGRRHDALIPETGWVHADELCRRCLVEALLAEPAPAGESARKGLLELREPDEMIAWLNDLNSNWAVCRNTRSFKEGQPSEYWKKFDKAMGAAFELQIALMKLAAGRSSQPAEPRDPAGKSVEVKP